VEELMSFVYNDESKILIGRGLYALSQGLESLLDLNITYKESQFNPRVSRIVTDKGVIANKTWSQAIAEMVKLGNGVLADGNAIARTGAGSMNTKYTVMFKSLPNVPIICDEDLVETLDEITNIEEYVILEEVVTEGITTEIESIIEVKTPDFEYAQSLLDVDEEKESRIKLEEYAREFDVELSRRKRFNNMMVDFKAAYNAE